MVILDNPRHAIELLTQARLQQGFTQTEVAEACGTTQSAASEWEFGNGSNLSTYMIRAAALGFRVALISMEEGNG